MGRAPGHGVKMKKIEPKDWIPLIKPYAKPNTLRSLRQVADTLLPARRTSGSSRCPSPPREPTWT